MSRQVPAPSCKARSARRPEHGLRPAFGLAVAARAIDRRGASRGLCAALAFLALALQLMFPAGFMAAPADRAQGMPIVICSAEGRILTDWDALSGRKSKAPAKPMATCAFAGHATGPPPPVPRAAPAVVAFRTPVEPRKPHAAFPGLGLAAPPPPAIGPPSSL